MDLEPTSKLKPRVAIGYPMPCRGPRFVASIARIARWTSVWIYINQRRDLGLKNLVSRGFLRHQSNNTIRCSDKGKDLGRWKGNNSLQHDQTRVCNLLVHIDAANQSSMPFNFRVPSLSTLSTQVSSVPQTPVPGHQPPVDIFQQPLLL